MKINHDYFRLSTKMNTIKYFLSQGHIFAHIKDRIKWYICPKFHSVSSFPSHIDIEASSECQLQCPMCGQQRMKSLKKGNMSFDLYKKIIDECAIHNVYSIKLSWRGEPLMNPHLFEMVAYAKQKGIKDVAFLTNVEKFDDEKIKSLMSSGVDWISCSVDGLYEVYNKIRYPAKFEETVEKIRKIKIAREQLSLSTPLIRVQTIFSAIRRDPLAFKKFLTSEII